MMKKILINSGIRYDKIALMDGDELVDFYVNDKSNISLIDNIYIGRVSDVIDRMDVMFVDIGRTKKGFLQLDNAKKMYKKNEKILVQVLKDEAQNKGVCLTQNITLVGRYSVLKVENAKKKFGNKQIFFSNEFNKETAKSIKENLNTIKLNENQSLIIRSEAINSKSVIIEEDVKTLLDMYDSILKTYDTTEEVKKLYEKELAEVIVNDFYDKSVDEILCDSDKVTKCITEKLKLYEIKANIACYDSKSNLPLFDIYKVDTQLKKALGKYVWLKNGAQIVIEHTEAMTVIDINTSKFNGKKRLEESVFETNIIAAREIARQIRLRNISGIIVIDFINMKEKRHTEKLLQELKRLVKTDKIKTEVVEITKLGLIELTRQKKRKMLKDIVRVIDFE